MVIWLFASSSEKLQTTVFLCNNPGHRAKESKSKTSAGQSTSDGSHESVLHIQKGKKKLKYFKEAFIKGKMLINYVDPGSEAVALPEDAASSWILNIVSQANS